MRDDFNVILRWDRDDWVTIHLDNIEESICHKYNFTKRPRNGDPESGLPYDYCSILHYDGKACSKVILIFYICHQ